ncbi:MAG: hypothetical protein OEW24_07895 [Chloroflexota bacterium]|nr:hypothetical protein [Chloroflexota bacterium]
MASSAESVSAFGRLWPEGPWVGTRRRVAGWELVFGDEDGTLRAWPAAESPAGRVLLIAAAAAHFADVLPDPPVLLEATQADLAGLLGWLAASEVEPGAADRAREALDAVDDGLASDAVVNLLNAYADSLRPEAKEQADPVDLLRDAYRALAAPGSGGG